MIRWALIAELTDFLPVLLFAQLLHAASYGALHAVSVQYIQGFFGKHHHGQGQALYSGLTFGAGGALGAWMSGFLVEEIGRASCRERCRCRWWSCDEEEKWMDVETR